MLVVAHSLLSACVCVYVCVCVGVAGPLLCYNQRRNYTTYLHPDAPNYDSVFNAVRRVGMKAYLYGSLSSKKKKGAKKTRVVLLNLTTLAPAQPW